MKYKEIELKYYLPDTMSSTKLNDLVSKITDTLPVYFKGEDYFYYDRTKPSMFCRHRVGQDINQLTLKEKTASDNIIRTEFNIDLKMTTEPTLIYNLLATMGFAYNTRIRKEGFLFKMPKYNLVYYKCFKRNRDGINDLGKFVEIELNEDLYWKNELTAHKELRKLEKKFKSLGISPKNRLTKSLWELYRE